MGRKKEKGEELTKRTTCMSVRLLKVYTSSTLMVASLAEVVFCGKGNRADNSEKRHSRGKEAREKNIHTSKS